MAAAADEHAERVRAAHQAKLARAEQLAAVAQQKKVEQAAELKKHSKLVAMRNEEVHHKRSAAAVGIVPVKLKMQSHSQACCSVARAFMLYVT